MSYNPNMFSYGVNGAWKWLKDSFYQPPEALDYADPEIPRLPLFTRAAAAGAAGPEGSGRAAGWTRRRRGADPAAGTRRGMDEQDLLDLATLIARTLN
jgi:hypothetical protein